MLKYKIPQIVTLTPSFQTEPRISYGELYKTKIAIISFPMIAITSCTRSGSQELNPYKTPIKYNTLIINTKILGYIVEYCK